ncbi:MAG: hypothetical protein ACE5J3_05720 [Methanosarcinales archaeon]
MELDIHTAQIRFTKHARERLVRIDPDIEIAIDVVKNVIKTGKWIRKSKKNGNINTVVKRYHDYEIKVEFAYRAGQIDIITIKVR